MPRSSAATGDVHDAGRSQRMRRRAAARSSRHGAAITCTPIGSVAWQPQHRHRAHRQADARDRLRQQAQARPRRQALAVDLDPLGCRSAARRTAWPARAARRRRGTARPRAARYQRRTRCACTTQAAGQQRAGEEAVARQRLEVVRRACAGRAGAARAPSALVITNAAARRARDLGQLDRRAARRAPRRRARPRRAPRRRRGRAK